MKVSRYCVHRSVLTLVLLAGVAMTGDANAQQLPSSRLVKERNVGVSRNGATPLPRSEGDQALVDGWPLYRTERSQVAFNDVMATLKATDSAAPKADAFKGCAALECDLKLPPLQPDGWLQPGRIWMSPNEYLLIAHSPRQRDPRFYRRRMHVDMKYFVLHEFQNSSRNTDVFDTISAHSGAVFVPLYMSKQLSDARGHRFVTVVQVAPYNVISIHASNKGSSGPGVEVAKNGNDVLEPLQASAGVLLATIIKSAAPQLKVVNHRGIEGLPMLQAYERQVAAARSRGRGSAVTLPFTPAALQRVASAEGGLGELIQRRGVSPKIPIAERGFLPQKPPVDMATAFAPSPAAAMASLTTMAVPSPQPALSQLAIFLRTNLATMMRLPQFAAIIPPEVASIAVNTPDTGVVYALNKNDQILGKFVARQDQGQVIAGQYVYAALDRQVDQDAVFSLDLTKPISMQSATLQPQAPATAEPPLPETIRRPSRR
jgi:hypothetical protein